MEALEWLFDHCVGLMIGFAFGMFAAALFGADPEPWKDGDDHPRA